ncbi:MAG: hypothetical protein AAGF11_25010 [Myxococcota bacterium]
MTDERLPRLDLLLLARLATAGRQPPSPSRLEGDLFRFVEARLSRREWSAQCARRLAALEKAKDIDTRRSPTPKGLERLRRALNVKQLPGTWSKIWRALVPALALDLPGTRWADLDRADKLRARLIRQWSDLPLQETPTLTQAVDAEIWRSLGLPETGRLTLGKLRRAVLERSLETALRAKSLDSAKAGQLLATAAAGTTTRNIDMIQRALVGRWLFEAPAYEARTDPSSAPEPRPVSKPVTRRPDHRPAIRPPAAPSTPSAPSAPSAPSTPSAPSAPSAPSTSSTPSTPSTPSTSSTPSTPSASSLPLNAWAQRVRALAEATPEGRYGDERIFIAAVWRTSRAEPSPLCSSLPAFKARLLEANRVGLLRLHRADLVGAADKALVRESELRHLNATFHLIEIPSRTAP